MKTKKIDWNPLLAILSDKKRILITSHARPDGDALGSEFAMCLALRAQGREAVIVNSDVLPEAFSFIDEDRGMLRIFGVDFLEEDLEKIDLAVIVDTSAKKQLPGIYEALAKKHVPIVVIDHHAVGDVLTADMFLDENAPAAGALVMDFLEFARYPITKKIAEYLFIAISTDTGWFRFPAVRPETFTQAARLMKHGAVPSEIYVQVNESYPFARTKLIGVFATNAVLEMDGRLAYSWITAEEFKNCGADYSETTDMVNLLLTTKGTVAAVAFMEHERGVRINFRSREGVNVAEIARKFGGGGHVKAAGAFLEKSLAEVIRTVLDEVRSVMVK